jgi:hypothetical protein
MSFTASKLLLVIIYFCRKQEMEGDFCNFFRENRKYVRFLQISVKMDEFSHIRFILIRSQMLVLFRVYLLVIVDCCSLSSVGCRVLTADCVGCCCRLLLFFHGCRVSVVGCWLLVFDCRYRCHLLFFLLVPSFAIVKINKNEL